MYNETFLGFKLSLLMCNYLCILNEIKQNKLLKTKLAVFYSLKLFFHLVVFLSSDISITVFFFLYMCRLWVSNLERSTHRVLNVVIDTPKPSSRLFRLEYTNSYTLEDLI